jgi:hypothetical protein
MANFRPSGDMHARFNPGGDLRLELDKQLQTAGLTLEFALQRVRAKIDSKRLVVVNKVAIETEDNDAQLRAIENVLKLHERAGRIPALQEQQNQSVITVNILSFNEAGESAVKERVIDVKAKKKGESVATGTDITPSK